MEIGPLMNINFSESNYSIQSRNSSNTLDLKAYENKALQLIRAGRLADAEKVYIKLIEAGSKNYIVFGNLAALYIKRNKKGSINEIISLLNISLKLNPEFAEGYNNLGNILKEKGDLDSSINAYLKAIQLNPCYSEAYFNLGNSYREKGTFKSAINAFKTSIKLKSNYPKAYNNLGAIMKSLGKLEEAALCMHKVIDIEPDLAETYFNLGLILKDLGNSKEEKNCYESCLKLKPNDLSFNLQSKLIISPIPFSQEQILLERHEINKNISIIGEQENIVLNHYPKSIDFIFYLAFHNCNNDKEILLNIANNLSKKNGIVNKNFNRDKYNANNKGRDKIRLGIISEYLFTHSVTRCYQNIIKDFANAGIEVILFKTGDSKIDKTSKLIESEVSESISLPFSLQSACNIIIEKSVDILFYLDIGMSHFTYLLSLSRLALVQVVVGGHPNTSGSPNIDYFISSKYLETETSDKYYSENLIRFSELAQNYSIPTIKESTFNRESLNLPNNSFLIGLPHTLFKIHPDFDHILDKILEEIPNSFLFLFEGVGQETKQLKSRWQKTTKLILDRAIIHPRAKFDDFLKVLKSMDIILDPFYFSMGNTFYQSMAFGIPIVTMPLSQARSRIVYAGYKQMDIKNPPIAKSPEEYVSICKKLASDEFYKNDIANQIISKSKEKLFNNKNIYKEYIEFFEKSIVAAKNNQKLPLKWTPNLKS